jgi:hypothetical protein
MLVSVAEASREVIKAGSEIVECGITKVSYGRDRDIGHHNSTLTPPSTRIRGQEMPEKEGGLEAAKATRCGNLGAYVGREWWG